MSSWPPPPPPHYHENPEHRPPPPEISPQQQPYPPPNSQGPPAHSQPPYPPPPPTRENSGPYPPDAYSRQGSVSAPTRSPAEPPRNHYPPPHSAPHDSPYYHHPPDYHRPHPAPYGPPEPQQNGTHPAPLHVQTGHEMMPGQPGPPPHHYGHHPPPHSAPPPSTPAGYYPPAYYEAGQQRRKPIRAAQACDSCRQRKAKCDEGRPTCQHCKENGLTCTYREMPPQKSEKQVMQISEKLETLSNSIEQLLQNQQSQQTQIQKLVELQTRFDPQDQITIKSEQKSKNKDGPSDFSMPPKHTTAVHHMFSWPLVSKLLPPNQSHTYVNDLELGRGLLRLYGCGEGEDKNDGHEGAPSPAGSQESVYDDDASSSSPHGVWGNGQLPTAPASSENNARDHPGGLSPRGGLMLDSAAVDSYFRSYMDHIYILHPFMETRVLRQIIHTFKRKYSWDYRPNHAVNAVAGYKRKRENTESPLPMEDYSSSFTAGAVSKPQARGVNVTSIEHSVANAIVLLVIALGKVCAHRDPLPGPASTSTMKTSTPHTMYSTLTDLPYTKSAPASPYNQLNGNGITAPSPSAAQGKNMDIIPGLSYFAKAADIIGELPGGVNVSYVQANLLAALYMGQLARIAASHHYISVACRGCQVLIDSTRYIDGSMSGSEKNLIDFAFWSSLQLESDILAEMDLPPSGITRYESKQCSDLPTSITIEHDREHNGRDNIHRFYSYQIQLRRTMNDIHSMLYKQGMKKTTGANLSLVAVLEQALHDWKCILGDWDWSDETYQDPDINVARMRAKYYGARYIIHRPVLRWCLSVTSPKPGHKYNYDDSPGAGDLSAIPSPPRRGYYPPKGLLAELDNKPLPDSFAINEDILDKAKTCIDSAIRSTMVFDKVPKRLIITNVFGTAHAQFGNVLILAATYTSPYRPLSSLIPEPTLRHLFKRTIDLLQSAGGISPVLAEDARILQHVRSQVFPNDFPPNSNSFSSQAR